MLVRVEGSRRIVATFIGARRSLQTPTPRSPFARGPAHPPPRIRFRPSATHDPGRLPAANVALLHAPPVGRRATPCKYVNEGGLGAMQAEADPPRARSPTVEGLLRIMTEELDWDPSDERASLLADGLVRHLGLARLESRAGGAPGRATALSPLVQPARTTPGPRTRQPGRHPSGDGDRTHRPALAHRRGNRRLLPQHADWRPSRVRTARPDPEAHPQRRTRTRSPAASSSAARRTSIPPLKRTIVRASSPIPRVFVRPSRIG